MIFKLTDEQIAEIIELYGGSKQTITIVEKKLNLIGIIDNEEDYFEVVCAVVAQKETVKFKTENNVNRAAFMNYDEIIKLELARKYSHLEEEPKEIEDNNNIVIIKRF